MVSKQSLRSEETRKAIVEAAGKLFSRRGYDSVTMREIAKEAGCSHTTIYIYFKDKEALLHQLSMGPLSELQQQFIQIRKTDMSPKDKLTRMSLQFIEFCLINRNIQTVIFTVKSVRVDDKVPELEINQVRNALFGSLIGILGECLPDGTSEDRILMYSRIYFFSLHGIVATYTHSEESVNQLMERLTATFQEMVEVLLIGITNRVATSNKNRR